MRVQVAHAAQGEGAIDVYEEPEGGALTTPLFADLAFGEVTPLADLPAADDLGTIDVTLTQAGNPGVILDEQLTAFPDGAATLQVVAGSQAEDTLLVATLVGSRRQLADSARLALYNAIEDQGVVDVYLIEPGDSFDRATSRTLVNNAQLGSTVPQFRTAPGTYALYIVRDNDDVILLGPVELVIAAGDVRQLITTDTADPGVSGLIDIDLTAF